MSTLSIGSLNQLGDAFENAGWTAEDVTKLKQFGNLGKIKDVLHGKALIAYPEHVINTDSKPFIPKGWSIKEHRAAGCLPFSSEKIKLQKCNRLDGFYFFENLAGEALINANVLDYLLSHKEIIPEEWKTEKIAFTGTVYLDSNRYRCVRCLYWNGFKWDWFDRSLASSFRDISVAIENS